uniref:5'-nucleotidase n=1 Tax=uncultured bacterium Csd4 TaxID=1637487 RepID=A0A0F6YSJ3_9BACT|nr:5'-nucleotidase [uncultured bacterium Csd4]
MLRKMISLLMIAMMTGMLSCTTHYAVTNVSRSRMLIDNTYDGKMDMQTASFMQPFTLRVDSLMSPVLGQAATPIEAYRPESPMSNLLPDILVWAAAQYGETPDFGVYNIGGMRASFAKGDITIGDVFDVSPFENHICFVSLSGEKVLELFGQIAYRKGEGVSKEVRIEMTADGKLLNATINGQPVDPGKTYRISTIDYLSHGNDRMAAFKSCTDRHDITDDGGLGRSIIMRYIQDCTSQGVLVKSEIEGRITIKE